MIASPAVEQAWAVFYKLERWPPSLSPDVICMLADTKHLDATLGGASLVAVLCERGAASLLTLALQLGASIEVDSQAQSPLAVACERGHAETVQVLLSHGANPDVLVPSLPQD
eukprot:3060470-Rhodomonas_salina.1